ncbi:hypothetical protein GQ53DRAFT_330218 [Thozetella sp. PMI_491]|nr:hypothetical protein GQ53DRAFT_330218 [Thozetella sp. PMI_491]
MPAPAQKKHEAPNRSAVSISMTRDSRNILILGCWRLWPHITLHTSWRPGCSPPCCNRQLVLWPRRWRTAHLLPSAGIILRANAQMQVALEEAVWRQTPLGFAIGAVFPISVYCRHLSLESHNVFPLSSSLLSVGTRPSPRALPSLEYIRVISTGTSGFASQDSSRHGLPRGAWPSYRYCTLVFRPACVQWSNYLPAIPRLRLRTDLPTLNPLRRPNGIDKRSDPHSARLRCERARRDFSASQRMHTLVACFVAYPHTHTHTPRLLALSQTFFPFFFFFLRPLASPSLRPAVVRCAPITPQDARHTGTTPSPPPLLLVADATSHMIPSGLAYRRSAEALECGTNSSVGAVAQQLAPWLIGHLGFLGVCAVPITCLVSWMMCSCPGASQRLP